MCGVLVGVGGRGGGGSEVEQGLEEDGGRSMVTMGVSLVGRLS